MHDQANATCIKRWAFPEDFATCTRYACISLVAKQVRGEFRTSTFHLADCSQWKLAVHNRHIYTCLFKLFAVLQM